MKINIHGSNVKITDAIKNYIEEKIGRLDKYLETPEEVKASVVARVNGKNQTIEVTIPLRKMILRGEESHNDLYAAIDLVSDKIERQIRKNKTRMKKKVNKESIMGLNIDFESNDDIANDETIVKRKVVDMKPMSEEEAILQMNLLGHEFFAFNNLDTENVSILYKRKDGNYGIIEMK